LKPRFNPQYRKKERRSRRKTKECKKDGKIFSMDFVTVNWVKKEKGSTIVKVVIIA
jgi:hypothetical protein